MTTRTIPVACNTLSVSAIGQLLHAMLLKYLAEAWVLSGEEVTFPLEPGQQERLLESLDVNELSKLGGYLEAIINLLDSDMHYADVKNELSAFWTAASILQLSVGSRHSKKIVELTCGNLPNFWSHVGQAAQSDTRAAIQHPPCPGTGEMDSDCARQVIRQLPFPPKGEGWGESERSEDSRSACPVRRNVFYLYPLAYISQRCAGLECRTLQRLRHITTT